MDLLLAGISLAVTGFFVILVGTELGIALFQDIKGWLRKPTRKEDDNE
jgi:hypothetical protein